VLQTAPAIGALLGLVLLVSVTHSHPTAQRISDELSMGPTFLTLALESAPALLVALVASGAVHAFMPSRVFAWLSRGSTLTQALRGLLVGPMLPVCSCGVLPIYRSMLARGAPRAAALTLLVAAPELGLATMLISWRLLGGPITLARGLAAVVAALVIGYGVARIGRGGRASEEHAKDAASAGPEPSFSMRSRLRSAIRYGFGDTVDHTMPWVMLGLALAAFAEPLLDAQTMARVPRWFEVPAFAVLGIPMYVCASGATPLVAVLLHKGISPGAAIAFLLTGPATNVTTFGVLKNLHGKKVAVVFASAMVVVPTLLGWLANVALAPDKLEGLHVAAHEPASVVEVGSLAVIVVLVAISLLRHGPRHMVAQLVTSSGHEH
jgi:uncharacterized membrane protein YraQ (UPF0718 family)